MVGYTSTYKFVRETTSPKDFLGSQISSSTFVGRTAGSGGSLITFDGSVANNGIEGGSVSILGIATFGYGTNGSILLGLGAFGIEGHVGVGIEKWFGEVSVGGSYSSNGHATGGDAAYKIGKGVWLIPIVVATVPLLAF